MVSTPAKGPKLIGVNLDRFTTLAEHDLGELYYGANGKVFRYVQFQDAVTYVQGHVVTQGTTGTDTWKVTNDRAGGSSVASLDVIGVLVSATIPTQDQFGWVQCGGQCAASGTYAAGDLLIPHATNDGEAVVSAYAAAKANFNIFAAALSTTRIKLRGLV